MKTASDHKPMRENVTAGPKDKYRLNGTVLPDALRRVAVVALLLPFLMLSLFSNGTMLTRTADDRVTVILCIGMEQVEMVWGEDGSLTPADEAPTQDHDESLSCDWQISTQAALAAEPAIVPPVNAIFAQNDLSVNVPLHARRINVLASSARGPPQLV